MTATEAQQHVVAMLEQALAVARRERAIACDIHIVHGDTTSSYRSFNTEAFAAAQELFDSQAQGGTQ